MSNRYEDATTDQPQLDGRKFGGAVHDVVAEMLERGWRTPTPLDIRSFIARHPLVLRPEIVYRQAARQRLITNSAVYFRFFAPSENWTFAAREKRAANRRLDIVWRTDTDAIVADELKAGRVAEREELAALRAQVEAQIEAGREAFGVNFAGVRGLVLGAPSKSFFANVDGTREPLRWEGIS